MGLLFTTEGTRRIVDTLNTAFDVPKDNANPDANGLRAIRKIAPSGSNIAKKLEKKDWPPGHLSRMLLLLPYDQSGNSDKLSDRHTKRWHYFLKTVVGFKTGKGSVFNQLQYALADAILNTAKDPAGNALNIVRVSFDHVEVPDSADMNIVVFDAPVQASTPLIVVRHITLFTKRVPEKNLNGTPNNGTAFDGPDGDLPDPASSGLNPDWATDPGTDPWNNPNP